MNLTLYGKTNSAVYVATSIFFTNAVMVKQMTAEHLMEEEEDILRQSSLTGDL